MPDDFVDAQDVPAEMVGRSHVEMWQRWGLELVKGMPFPNLDNCVRILTNHPDLRQQLWFDEFKCAVMMEDAPYIHEDMSGRLAVWVQRMLRIHRITPGMMGDAVEVYARTHTRHPLREWVDSLKWDGTERLKNLIAEGWGAKANDYHSGVGRCWLISMMARLYKPGCQVDTMPVFEGEQGGGKSSALAILGGPHYIEISESMESREFMQLLPGSWLVEIAELESISRSSLERVKATITRRNDVYRAPYARRAAEHQRCCVMVGTTNSYTWINDETGARRFWPVRCGRINQQWLKENREQIFAEARDRYKNDEDWYKMPATDTKTEAESRYNPDPWEDGIAGWLQDRLSVTIDQVLSGLNILPADRDTRHSRRAGAVLRHLGYLPTAKRQDGRVVKLYVKATEALEPQLPLEPGAEAESILSDGFDEQP